MRWLSLKHPLSLTALDSGWSGSSRIRADGIVDHHFVPERPTGLAELVVGVDHLVVLVAGGAVEGHHQGVGVAAVDDGAVGVRGPAEVAEADRLDRDERLQAIDELHALLGGEGRLEPEVDGMDEHPVCSAGSPDLPIPAGLSMTRGIGAADAA